MLLVLLHLLLKLLLLLSELTLLLAGFPLKRLLNLLHLRHIGQNGLLIGVPNFLAVGDRGCQYGQKGKKTSKSAYAHVHVRVGCLEELR